LSINDLLPTLSSIAELSAKTTYKRRAIYQFSGRLFRCIKYHPLVCSSLSDSPCDRPGLPAG